MTKTIVGIRPTGKLHIGHYLSVVRPALEEGAEVLVAKYHVSPADHCRCLAMWHALHEYGIDAHIQYIDTDLYFKLLSFAKIGELERMTQYKSSDDKTPHLLVYPVLMAHDLVGYDRVIVGEDQKQHIEYANKLFKRAGYPKVKGDYRGGRVMSLTDPTKKMSKTEPRGCLFLDDTPEEIKKKIIKAVTTPAGAQNLQNLAKLFYSNWDPKNNYDSKVRLANSIISTLHETKD